MDLDESAQIAQLMPLAVQAADQLGLSIHSLEAINHGYNTTFKVQTKDGNAYALRINTNSKKSRQEVLAEVELLDALQDVDGITTPVPHRSITGDAVAIVRHPELGELPAVALTWLPGEIVGDSPTPEQLHLLGAAMARLHVFTETWTPTAPAQLPLIATPLLGTPDRLTANDHGVLPAALHQKVLRALEFTERTHARLRSDHPLLPIHCDMHPENAMWHQGSLSVIDFDDLGVGLAVQDLANSTYYLRNEPSQQQALLDGYAHIRPLPDINRADFELLLVSRQLVLLNTMMEMTTAAELEFRPQYLEWVSRRLDHFFEHGEFLLLKG